MKKLTQVSVAVLAASLIITSCRMVETEPNQAPENPSVTADDYYANNRDAVGSRLAKAEDLTLEEHYELAAERYQDFNEFYAEVQAEIRSEPWKSRGYAGDLVILDGGNSGWAPRGATSENSYYFRTRRWIDAGDQDRVEFIRQVAEQWTARGWEIEHQDIVGASRYVAFTDEGFWLEIFESPRSEDIEFTAHSPVYWGPYSELLVAMADRVRAEAVGGVVPEHMETADEDGVADRSVGDYDRFPDWDTFETYPPVENPGAVSLPDTTE